MRHLPRAGGWRGVALGLSLAFVGGLLVPLVTSDTRATWTADTHANGGSDGLGTSRIACDTGSDDYTTAASSTLLQGTVAGQDLAQVAQVVPVDLVSDKANGVVDPGSAHEVGSDRTTWRDPLALGVLGSGVLDLSGLALGVAGASVGAVNQVAKVTVGGVSSAAAGLVTDSGAIVTGGTGSTTPGTQPGSARLQLSSVVPQLSGVTDVADVALDVGAASSSSSVDGCATLRRALWGDGAVSGVVRDYGVAGLALELTSKTLSSVIAQTTAAASGLDTTVTQLAGTNGLIDQTIKSTVSGVLGPLLSGLQLGSATGTVSITGTPISTAVSTIFDQPITSGGVTVNAKTGTVRVDLAQLLGDAGVGLNDRAPNTTIVLSDTLVNQITQQVSGVLDAVVQRAVSAIDAATRALVLHVNVDVKLTAVLLVARIDVLDVVVRTDSSIGDLLDGRTGLTANVTLLNGVPLALGDVTNALTAGLIGPVLQQLRTSLQAPLGTLTTALRGVTGPVLSSLSPVFSSVAGLITLQVNVQRDTSVQRSRTDFSTGEHAVTALQIRIPGLVDLAIATSSVGPNVLPRAAR